MVKTDKGTKKVRCPASVRQMHDGTYIRNNQPHHHAPDVGAKQALRVKAKVMKKALSSKFASANKMVREVLREELATEDPKPAMPSVPNLIRAANRRRQGLYPKVLEI